MEHFDFRRNKFGIDPKVFLGQTPPAPVFPRLNVVFDLVTKIQIKMFVKLKYRTLNQKQHLYPFINSK